jgi:DNA-binding transcriptional regulator YiaG
MREAIMVPAMRSKEFVAALAALDLTRASAARFFGVSLRAVTNWCSPGKEPPAPVSVLTRYMLAKGITPGEVAKAIGEEGPHSPPSRRR